MNKSSLAGNSLGINESIIMGVAGAAPAFSVSAVTSTLVASVHTLAPASVLYCGILLFGITLAFLNLNKINTNAGASYAWISVIFNPTLGFFAGWALLVCSAVFMVSGSIPAATATLLLIEPKLANMPGWVTFVAALWLTVISAILFKGIKSASYLQVLMTGTEMIILIAIIIGSIIQFSHLPAHEVSINWFSITDFTPHSFATGALTAVFLFWGWDVTLNLNEETQNAKFAPGWGALWSVIIIMVIMMCFFISALLVLNDHEIQQAGTNILFTIADKIFPRPWSYLAVLAVVLSSVGTLETTILQFTRTLFAKSRDGVLHKRYATIHHSRNTPWVGIVFIWIIGIVFLFLSSWFTTVSIIIQDSVKAIGFQVAFYYSLTGFACAWYYRLKWNGIMEGLIYVLWPILSSLFLIYIALFSISTFDWVTNMVGIGGLAIGMVPFITNYKQIR